MDNRTSHVCISLDNQVFKVDDMMSGVNAPSMHCFCRSTTVGSFDGSSGKRIAKNLNDGKYTYIDDKIGFHDWESSYID